jgi:hypothetical protein
MATPPLPQLFGIIPTGLPPIITPATAPTPTSLLYTLPARPYNHIVVFILPGITLPPNSAAAVYIQLPSGFKFLGAVGEGKESAVFRIKGLGNNSSGGGGGGGGAGNGNGEVDMDAPIESTPPNEITLGISIESAESVATQLASLQQQNQSSPTTSSSGSQALVLAGKGQGKGGPDTVVLAQRIIKNAFNFLASFSGNTAGGVEVVPLKAFEEWWRKFEGRVRSDPGFLEREGD